MKKKTILLIIVILAILQVTFLNYVRVFSVKPDLLLISMVIVSLSFELRRALFFSIAAAILKDIFSINTFGINTLLFTLWSFLIVKLSRKLELENNIVRSALVFVMVILNDTATRLVNLIFGVSIPIGIFLRVSFLESLYTALISPLVFRFIK